MLELSELQLPTLSRGTTVAAYTNVTADHLDRHGSLEAYRRVKRRLAELVDPAGALVINLDDPVVAGYGVRHARRASSRIAAASCRSVASASRTAGSSPTRSRRSPDLGEPATRPSRAAASCRWPSWRCPGAHNVSNALAAVAVALLFGVPAADDPARPRRGSRGVEHRLERVAEIDGVRFVNDSQGTQPDAVIAALRAFDGPIVLIAGGRDKGVDLTELAAVVGACAAAAAVLIGESGPELERLFRDAGLAVTERAASLEAAVEAADALAREARSALVRAPGGAAPATATVLLSPAAASFDMFEDYEARGRAFKAAVARLVEARG